jgi:hypothetical protein
MHTLPNLYIQQTTVVVWTQGKIIEDSDFIINNSHDFSPAVHGAEGVENSFELHLSVFSLEIISFMFFIREYQNLAFIN